MIVRAEVMRQLIALHEAAIEAAQRRDEAVALVLATVGAEPGSQIVVLPDGCGEVVTADKKALPDAPL